MTIRVSMDHDSFIFLNQQTCRCGVVLHKSRKEISRVHKWFASPLWMHLYYNKTERKWLHFIVDHNLQRRSKSLQRRLINASGFLWPVSALWTSDRRSPEEETKNESNKQKKGPRSKRDYLSLDHLQVSVALAQFFGDGFGVADRLVLVEGVPHSPQCVAPAGIA